MAGRPPTKEAPPFGKRLAELRKARGLSQEQFGKLMDTNRATIDYYERKATNPGMAFIEQAAGVLGVTAADLVGSEAPTARAKRGPKSRLELQFQLVSQLPKQRQAFVSKLLDELLSNAS